MNSADVLHELRSVLVETWSLNMGKKSVQMDVVSVPCFLSVSSVSGVHCYGLVQRPTSCAVGVFSCTDRLSCGFWE